MARKATVRARTRARTSMAAITRIATTIGIQASRKPGHMLEFKTRKKKEKVSSWCIGADAENDVVFYGGDNPREGRQARCWSTKQRHFFHLSFAKKSPPSTGLTLRDVQGNTLSHHGTRHVNLTVGTRGQRAKH